MEGDYSYYPLNNNCLLKHAIFSTDTEFGISAIILNDPKVNCSPLVQSRIKDFLKNQDCRPVILQTCLPGNDFLSIDDDKNVFVIPHTCYLELLNFFKNDWPKISARIEKDRKEMTKGAVPISATLSFKGEGIINYRHELGPIGKDILYLVVQANSKDSFIEIFFQLNLQINIEGVVFSPFPLIVLSNDFDTLQNILNYKCKKAKIVAC